MRDEHDGARRTTPEEIPELRTNALARVGVQRGKWLVHEEQLGLDGPGADQGDALAHALRQLPGPSIAGVPETDQRQIVESDALAVRAGHAAQLEAVFDIAHRAAPRQQGVARGNEADARAGFGGPDAENGDIPRGRRHQAGQDVEDRRLAAAGSADQRDELSTRHVEMQVAHHTVFGAVGLREGHRECAQRNGGWRVHAVHGSRGRHRSSHRSAAALIMLRMLAMTASTMRIPYTASILNSPE